MERGKLKRVHYVSNLSTALKFLESKKVTLLLFCLYPVVAIFYLHDSYMKSKSIEVETTLLKSCSSFYCWREIRSLVPLLIILGISWHLSRSIW